MENKFQLEVPFYSNAPDNMHCFEANLKMTLKYFWPDENYSWEDLEKITHKVTGLYTWPLAALLWIQEKGAEIINIECFEYEKFIEKGGEYIRESFGDEVADTQIKYSDIAQEQELAKDFIKKINTRFEIPTINAIKELILNNYVVICTVNSKKMNGLDGYASHSIIVKGYDENGFIIHNPGIPPSPDQFVTYEIFERAWAYPDEKSKNITAIKF